jgi:hypothetical protein
MNMTKLDTAKQAILDAWAAAAAKGTDAKAEINAATGEVVKPSATTAMMEALQGELTESALDAAMAKANPKTEPKPGGDIDGGK